MYNLVPFFYAIILLLALSSCRESDEDHEEPIPQIKDYNGTYVLKNYIDAHPEHEHFDSLVDVFLQLKVQFWAHWESPPPPPHYGRNFMKVEIYKDSIMVNGTKSNFNDFKDSIVAFIIPNKNYQSRVESKFIRDRNGVKRTISKSKIDFIVEAKRIHHLQPYYVATQQAFYALKNELAIQWYNQEYPELDSLKAHQLDSLFQNRTFIISRKEYLNSWYYKPN